MIKKDSYRTLTSLAVFREFYDTDKDIYSVINEFAKEIIRKKSLYSFTLIELTESINEVYDFELPLSVVKSAIKRLEFLDKTEGHYIINSNLNNDRSDFTDKHNRIQTHNDTIIKNLIKYVEKQIDKELDENEKRELIQSFINYLLEETSSGKYNEYISAYIIEYSNEPNFLEMLNTIKQGVILYSGIKYTDINMVGSWTTYLTIYLDTEILFHISGYNGELFEKISFDLINLINEINNKTKQKLIELKYFFETKDEIENFFYKAEMIVSGKDLLNPNSTAMRAIVNGCKTKSDVVNKKSDFYNLLKTNNIYLDKMDKYSNDKNYKYNIISNQIVQILSENYDIVETVVKDELRKLNYINMMREGENNKKFEDIGYVFLTGNSNVLKMAFSDVIKNQGEIPLATDINFLINKFWFKLNKGFGLNKIPKVFDVITKAQIILSKFISDSISTKYENLIQEYENGKIDKEIVISRIVDLRQKTKLPESIEAENVTSLLSEINEDSIEKHLNEQERLRHQAEKSEEENKKLREQLIETNRNANSNKSKMLNDKIKTLYKYRNELIDNKAKKEKQKNRLDLKAAKKYLVLKITIILFFLIYYSSLYYIILDIGWETSEKILTGLNILPVLLSVLYLLITEKTFNPIKILNQIKNKYILKTYNKYFFDIKEYEENIKKIEAIDEELKDLEQKN